MAESRLTAQSQEVASRAAISAQASLGGGVAQPIDMNLLLAQYGQAMIRVGQLECELQLFKEKFSSSTSTEVAASEGKAYSGEIERELKKKDETIASLRVQLMAMRAELARTEEKLKLAAEGAYMRHKHRRRWWKFWRWFG